jgi:hypothetical protein
MGELRGSALHLRDASHPTICRIGVLTYTVAYSTVEYTQNPLLWDGVP